MASLPTSPPAATALPTGPPWLRPVVKRRDVDACWLVTALAMFAAALLFFGWRGVMGALVAAAGTLAIYGAISLVRWLTRVNWPQDSPVHALTLGLLLGLSLPPLHHPLSLVWPGLFLGVLASLTGRARLIRLHPVAGVLVLLWLGWSWIGWGYGGRFALPADGLGATLRPHRLVLGDLHQAVEIHGPWTWWDSPEPGPDAQSDDAILRERPDVLFLGDRRAILQHPSLLVEMLASGELLRLEELLLGSAPGPAGASSRALLILLGFYLMYRRQSDWLVVVMALSAALAAALLMPLTIAGQTIPMGLRLASLGPASAATYLGYLLLAPPLLLSVLILAPWTMPISRAGRVIYGLVVGGAGMTALWISGEPMAVYGGLLLASLASRPLDLLQQSPFAAPEPT